MSEPVEGTTHRTLCQNGRITYHPEWSATQPWASYWRGSAGLHFRTIYDASMYFRERHGAVLVVT